MEWSDLHKTALSNERDERWPAGVYAISMEGLSFLGVHEKDRKLYWDGREVVTRTIIRLRGYELLLATIAAGATFGMFLLALGSTCGWW
jgi:hypothetical protein